MSPLRLLILAGSAALTLAACSPQSPARDKAYYAAHADERASQLQTCQGDPGRLAATPNCVNAQAADADAHAAHFYDVQKPAPRVANPGQL